MYQRQSQQKLIQRLQQFPAVGLLGPRQVGKTTLAFAQKALYPDALYLDLELPSAQRQMDDPEAFLMSHAQQLVILDEVQRAPELFSYLQGFIDERRSGPVLLTGSQNFQLSERISQSLAGRAAVLELLPFSHAEASGRAARSPSSLASGWSAVAGVGASLDEAIFVGGYPAIHDRSLDPRAWLDAYLRTYVERDVRALANIGDLATFTRFLRLCVGRVGQLLNLSALGADAGIDHTTARRWISILEASYVIRLLPPHFRNFSKRLVKTPKIYFLDCGLAATLLGIRSPSDLATHPLRGALVENFVVTELVKVFLHHGESAPVYFWRDHAGHEVDILVEFGAEALPIEVKSGVTVPADAFAGLRKYGVISGRREGVLVHGGSESYGRGDHVVQSWEGIS